MEAQATTTEAAAAAKETALAALREQLATITESKGGEIQTLSESIIALRAQNESTQREKAQALADKATLQETEKRLRSAIDEAAQELEKFSRHRAEIAKLKAQVSEVTLRAESVESEKSLLEQRYSALEQISSSRIAQTSEIDTLLSSLSSLRMPSGMPMGSASSRLIPPATPATSSGGEGTVDPSSAAASSTIPASGDARTYTGGVAGGGIKRAAGLAKFGGKGPTVTPGTN
jgi:hypothetical protein